MTCKVNNFKEIGTYDFSIYIDIRIRTTTIEPVFIVDTLYAND